MGLIYNFTVESKWISYKKGMDLTHREVKAQEDRVGELVVTYSVQNKPDLVQNIPDLDQTL